jgi:hypothetical protein
MTTPYAQRSVALAETILKEQYFMGTWRRTLSKMSTKLGLNLSPENFQNEVVKMQDQQINNVWFEFWADLPDSPTVKFGPFHKLCDLSESCD